MLRATAAALALALATVQGDFFSSGRSAFSGVGASPFLAAVGGVGGRLDAAFLLAGLGESVLDFGGGVGGGVAAIGAAAAAGADVEAVSS